MFLLRFMNFCKNTFRFRIFICAAFALFLLSLSAGFFYDKFSGRDFFRAVSLVQLARRKIQATEGLGGRIIVLFFYSSFIMLFIYLLSLTGVGILFFIFVRGFLTGMVVARTWTAPLSFFLVSPFGALETVIILVSFGAGLYLSWNILNMILGAGRDKKVFIDIARFLGSMTPFLIASYFIDTWILSLIF